jgi:heme oxygenase
LPRSCYTAAMAKTTRSELHDRLRQAAKAPHRLMDHHPLLTPLLRDDLTVGQYGDALAALHGVYAPLEAGIDGFLRIRPQLFDYHTRRKLPSLNDDLAELARLPCEAEMCYPAPPPSPNWSACFIPSRDRQWVGDGWPEHCSLPEQGGFDTLPTRFFSGHGEHADARWREFLVVADASCPARP